MCFQRGRFSKAQRSMAGSCLPGLCAFEKLLFMIWSLSLTKNSQRRNRHVVVASMVVNVQLCPSDIQVFDFFFYCVASQQQSVFVFFCAVFCFVFWKQGQNELKSMNRQLPTGINPPLSKEDQLLLVSFFTEPLSVSLLGKWVS